MSSSHSLSLAGAQVGCMQHAQSTGLDTASQHARGGHRVPLRPSVTPHGSQRPKSGRRSEQAEVGARRGCGRSGSSGRVGVDRRPRSGVRSSFGTALPDRRDTARTSKNLALDHNNISRRKGCRKPVPASCAIGLLDAQPPHRIGGADRGVPPPMSPNPDYLPFRAATRFSRGEAGAGRQKSRL